MSNPPPARTVATARKRAATKPVTQRPFDTTDIAAPWAERAIIANLLPVFAATATADDIAQARQIIATLTPEMLTEPVAADALAAYTLAINADQPSLAGVTAAARQLTTDGGSAKTVMTYITDAGIKATSWHVATQVAAEAAAEIRGAYHRRQTLYALEAVCRTTRNGKATPSDITAAIESLSCVRDALDGQDEKGRRLQVRTAADITPKQIDWLWPDRISTGALTLITGLPGASKTTLTYDIAARITRGGKWPDGSGTAPRGGIILLGMEDDVERVVVPRLIAANADLSMVRIVDGVQENRSRAGETWLSPLTIERDLALVSDQLDAFPECKAVILDPLSQFVAAEENSNAETRSALTPLITLAQGRGVTIIGIAHLSKKTDAHMIQRIAGASTYGQMARHVLFVGNDPNDETDTAQRRRVMLVAKTNYGERNVGQLFCVKARSSGQPSIEWIEGVVRLDAETLNRPPTGVNREHQQRREDAVDALRDLLAHGPRPAVQVEAALEQQGFGRRQIAFAVKKLAVQKQQAADDTGRRFWSWSLPEATATDQPAPHGPIPIGEWSAW